MSSPQNTQRTLSLRARAVAGAMGGVMLTLLIVAAWLTPNELGLGTHTQLGLTECFVVVQWGVRCPSCGMTTAWARLLDGDLVGSVAANAAGFLLALLALVATPWLLASAALGKWWYCRPRTSLVFTSLVVVAMVALFDWMRHTGVPLLQNSPMVEKIFSAG